MEKAFINGLSDRDLEILDVLGFKEGSKVLSEFLEQFLKTFDTSIRRQQEIISELHQKGVALRSVKKILKKINPNHKIFQKRKEKADYEEEILSLMLSAGGTD